MNRQYLEQIPFGAEHLDGLVRLSEQVGWPHRREDLALVAELCEGVALVEGAQVMGTAFAARFGSAVTMLNLILVDESLRGQGYGQQLLCELIDRAGDREQRLIATQAGLRLYARNGFEAIGHLLKHQGVVNPNDEFPNHSLGASNAETSIGWSIASERDEIVTLDSAASGMRRASLVDALLNAGQLAVARISGRVTGFAAVRPFGVGEQTGPVVAASEDDAKALLSFVFSSRPGVMMRVDTDEAMGLSAWLTSHGLAHVGGGVRMHRMSGDKTESGTVATYATYALANQALG